jgi:voltage-gated potassium channel
MVRLRAVHFIAIAIIISVFAMSTALVALDGYPLVTALLFSFLNIIGATFPPIETIVDKESPFILVSVALGGIANIAFIITFTAIFYQILSNVELHSFFFAHRLRKISKHVVITPINSMGIEFAKTLKENKIPFLFVDENKYAVRKALRQGLLAFHGSMTDTNTLEKANATASLAVYALYDDDIKNTFVAIGARKIGRNVKVISRIKHIEDIAKMERSGARRVILPEATIGIAIGDFLVSKE